VGIAANCVPKSVAVVPVVPGKVFLANELKDTARVAFNLL
jgi:hypothetical protein